MSESSPPSIVICDQTADEVSHLMLIIDARHGFADVKAGRTQDAYEVLTDRHRHLGAKHPYRVALTSRFMTQLASSREFLEMGGDAAAYEDLLTDLRDTVVPNLASARLIGQPYLLQPPQTTRILSALAQLPPGQAEALRMCRHMQGLCANAQYQRGAAMLYAVDTAKSAAYLLTMNLILLQAPQNLC